MIKRNIKKEPDFVYLVATSIIKNESEEILLLKRSHDSSYEDFWQLPEGKIEMREKPRDAIIREMKEETGLEVKIEEMVFTQDWEFSYEKGSVWFKRFIFRTKALDGKIKLSHEHTDYKWVKPEDAVRELKLIQGIKEIIKELLR